MVENKLKMVIGYLNESRVYYLDNFHLGLNFYNAFKLSRKFRVDRLHIYGVRPPPSFLSCFLRTKRRGSYTFGFQYL